VLGARATLEPPAAALVRGGLRMGSLLAATAHLKALAHPQWLTEPACVAMPRRELVFAEPEPPDADQLALCARIAAAYRIAGGRHAAGGLSPIWKGKVGRYYGVLERSLLAGDPHALNEQLRWMFRRPFLAGISTPIDYEDPTAPRHWALRTYDCLAALAEALGVVRAECPEQGIVGRIFAEGLDTLPQRIEASVGVSLDFPRVGAPYGVLIGGRLITRETARHLYAALWLREAIELHLVAAAHVRIVEIGGGFAGAAMWYLRLPQRPPGSYTIVDLPLMNAFQAYFLGRVHGAGALQLCGEPSLDSASIRVLPTQVLTGSQSLDAEVVFNQDSLPECGERAARDYLSWMQAHVRGLFLSCNQETATPIDGVPQLVVPELAGEYDGLQRLTRRPSWVRRGYVEEVYRCGG
jgi:hypothetical protein